MKKHSGGQFGCWRSFSLGRHATAGHAPLPPVDGQNSGSGHVADNDGHGERSIEAEARRAGRPPASGHSVGEAMQLAIGLLTASLDSTELEAWALPALVPADANGIADLLAGLHLISELVIRELHEATGEPPEAVLQRLAMLAEHQRGLPSTG
jgi:hypothetical protein